MKPEHKNIISSIHPHPTHYPKPTEIKNHLEIKESVVGNTANSDPPGINHALKHPSTKCDASRVSTVTAQTTCPILRSAHKGQDCLFKPIFQKALLSEAALLLCRTILHKMYSMGNRCLWYFSTLWVKYSGGYGNNTIRERTVLYLTEQLAPSLTTQAFWVGTHDLGIRTSKTTEFFWQDQLSL